MTRVLIIVTGADTWTMKDGTPHPTGFWSEELVKPHQIFTKAGFDVTIASPRGVTPTLDPLSMSLGYNDDDQSIVDGFQEYLDGLGDALQHPAVLEEQSAADYDVVFQVGGHGPMQDLAVHPTIGKLFVDVLDDDDKILAAVCHGPAAFLSAHREDGTWAFRGRHLTGFSNTEETMATFAGNAPWLLEDRLKLAGAIYEEGEPYKPHFVRDGNLITGQQEVSAQVTAEAVLEALGHAG